MEFVPAERLEFYFILIFFQEHPWVTSHGAYPLPSEEENCSLVEVTEEDMMKVVTSVPKLDTLILVKAMLKKHSFQVNKFFFCSFVSTTCR